MEPSADRLSNASQPATDAWFANVRAYQQSTDRRVTDDSERAEHLAPTHSMVHHPYALDICVQPVQPPQQTNNQTFDRNVPALYLQRGLEIPVSRGTQSLSQARDQRADSASEYARQLRRANITDSRGVRTSPATDDTRSKRQNVRRDGSR
ncbi:hypothetical protein LTR49_021606 [Elasticomyces elasticus]|nr:hypothetical protein LTR49_021606 [Elasticomyces elasticus]